MFLNKIRKKLHHFVEFPLRILIIRTLKKILR
ncbi:MAG: hypothetical protein JWM68_3244 [Verrucomicrobiales bacterium]|nr:hypothetical protein [Verrucomicrobiales bacterium]